MRLARRGFTFAGLVALAGAAVTGGLAAKRVRDAQAEHPPVGEFIEVDGQRIHYLRKGQGQDVVLLHAAGGNLRQFTFDLMDRLTDRYTVTAFDRPGLGYSDRARAVDDSILSTEGESPQQQADILRQAARALGITSPIVVGHSFGGIVSMAWANAGLHDPDASENASAVVSLAGVMMSWPGDLGWYYTLNGSKFGGAVTVPVIAAFASDKQIDQAIIDLFAPQPAPEGYAEHIGATLNLRPAQFRASVRQVNSLYEHVVEMEKDYPRLTLPIEIVHGDKDLSVPIDVHALPFLKVAPSANLTTLPGVGHMPHHADPDATIAAIDRAASRAGLR